MLQPYMMRLKNSLSLQTLSYAFLKSMKQANIGFVLIYNQSIKV